MRPDERDPSGGVARIGLPGSDAREASGTAMRVLALDPAGGTLACCAGVDGVAARIETALVGPLELGAIVLVQGGIALARMDLEWVP